MDKRKLARRKEKIASLREQEARVTLALREKALRDKEAELGELRQKQEEAEAQFRSTSPGSSAWLEVWENSRQMFLKKEEEFLSAIDSLKDERNEALSAHRKTLEGLRSSEKVTEKVAQEWQKEQLFKEGKELDEAGSWGHRDKG